MQSAGLRSITARHLAMAAQTVALLGLHVPLLKRAFACRLPSKQQALVGVEFEHVVTDLRHHHAQLFSKLQALAAFVGSTAVKTARAELSTITVHPAPAVAATATCW